MPAATGRVATLTSMTTAIQLPEPETIGPFTIHPPIEGMGHPVSGWAVAYGGAWLPGIYADREAVMVAMGLVLGGEQSFYVDELRDRYNRKERRNISVADIMELALSKKPLAEDTDEPDPDYQD